MFYSRGKDGKIDGAYGDPQRFDPKNPKRITTEELADDHPDVVAWRAASAPPRWVPKPVILTRLHAAGLLVAADAALNAHGGDSAKLLLAERWYAAQAVRADDPDARDFLAKIGADPDSILAQEVTTA